MDVDLVAMGCPAMTDGRFDAITKAEYANANRPNYVGHPSLRAIPEVGEGFTKAQ